jgi:hypothetical protein
MIPPAEELTHRLTGTRITLLENVRSLGSSVLGWSPGADEPSILEVLATLPAAERHYRSQALRIRFEAWSLTTPFVADSVQPPPPAEVYENLEIERRITLFALNEIEPEEWDLRCRHAFLGEVSLGWILEEILRNERRSLRTIREVLAQLPLTGGR